MLKCLNNDSKIQMRLNIKRHRQKLLQYLENINDTVLKPKIKLVSNDLEKNNFNRLISNDVEKSNFNKLVTNDVEKSNLKILVSSDIDKSNLNKLDSNDAEKSNLNKLVSNDVDKNKLISNDAEKNKLNILVSNDIEKSNLNHNVKPKIASSADWQNPKRRSTIKFTNYKNKSSIRIKTYERVINTKPENHEILTNIDIKKYNTRSSLAVNQLQPNSKINIQEEPLSNVEFKPEPLPEPKIEIKYPEPNIEIKDHEPPITVKKLKEQLIEELLEDSSSSEEIEDNISVGSNEDWNEIYQTHIENDADENDSSNSSLIEADKYDRHKQLAKGKNEEYLYYSGNSDNSVLDINYPTTSKRNETGKIKILTKPQFQIDQPKHRFRKPQDRDIHNAKERACRERIAKKFAILRKSCSYLNTNRRVPSKHSILLAAKKECDLLKHFEKKMLAEKKVWRKANENLRKRIADFVSKDSKLACLI